MIRPLLTLLLLASTLTAQQTSPTTPTRIVEVTFGQFGGRGEAYLPGSVLGPPDTSARAEVAATDPAEILSLGLDGTITLEFVDQFVTDGPGPDLTIFENAFLYRLGDRERVYAEPGEVSVSRDGVVWQTFPFDSLTLVGAAGVTPTNGDADPFDPKVSGGDHFDLAAIGVDSIRFVRVRDVTRVILGNRDHPLYDATLNGFDLDAVVAYSTAPNDRFLSAPSEGLSDDRRVVRADFSDDLLNLEMTRSARAALYSVTGELIAGPFDLDAGRSSLYVGSVPSGVCFLVAGDGAKGFSPLHGVMHDPEVIRLVR